MKGKVANLRSVNHILIALCLLLTILAQAGQAQDVANGQATATVQAALAVTATNNLIFGNVLQGVAKTVGNNVDASSGQFAITGQGSAGISVYLTMPTYMALADGSDRMTIAFANTDAIVDTTVATPATAVAADGGVDVNPRGLNSLAAT